MVFYITIFALAALGLAVTIALTFIPSFQVWLLERAGRRIGLGVPADLDASFRLRMGRRIRASSVGCLVGLALALVLALVFPESGLLSGRPVFLVYYGLIALSVVGSDIGVAVVSLASTGRRHDERPRVARLRVTRVGDYLPPLLFRLAVATAVCSVVTVALMIVLVAGRLGVGAVIAGVALVVGAGGAELAFPVVARRIVAQGRPTVDTDEMVWDDALRSEALRDLLSAPLQALAFGAWYSVIGTIDSVGAWILIPSFASLGLVAVFNIALRNNRDWFLFRLWPGARRRTDDEEAARLAARAIAP